MISYTSLPSEYLYWAKIDSNLAKAILEYGQIMVSSILSFNEQGHITKMNAARNGTVDGSYSRDNGLDIIDII